MSDYGKGSDNSSIEATSDIQTFGLIVTAEPYYGVTQPSDVVVMENVVRPDTQGVKETINARYELLPRGMYTSQGKASGFVPIHVDKKDPFELYEAENAVQLSRIAGADKYAADSFNQALAALDKAHQYQSQKPGQKPVITMAREAVVRAEDARVVALRRERDELETNRLNAEKVNEPNPRGFRPRKNHNGGAQADADRIAADTAKKEALAAAEEAQSGLNARRKCADREVRSRSSAPGGDCPAATVGLLLRKPDKARLWRPPTRSANVRMPSACVRMRSSSKRRCGSSCSRSSIRFCKRATPREA